MKILKLILKILGFALAAAFAFLIVFIVSFNMSMGDEFKKDRFLGEYTSPDETHMCSARIAGNGITAPWTVVAQVKGKGIFWKRTIYVAKHLDEAIVIWLDNRTVWINGVSLDIYKDKYVSDINITSEP